MWKTIVGGGENKHQKVIVIAIRRNFMPKRAAAYNQIEAFF
jgi:hypothetical protein